MRRISGRKVFTTAIIGLFFAGMLVSYGQNTGGSDAVLRAMNDELNRSMAELQLKDLDKPYFIQYAVIDEEEFSSEATFGALTYARQTHQRVASAQVRVGNYDFDNTGFGGGGGPGGGGGGGGGGAAATGARTSTVVDDNYEGLRHSLWLVTDTAYKQAAETIARKRASLQNRVQGDKIPDFSKEAPTRSIGTPQKLEVDRAAWEKNLREWSGIFKSFPEVQGSSVRILARLQNRYTVNSEGTQILQPIMFIAVIATAGASATDGMRINNSIPFYARSFSELPSSQEIGQAIRQLAVDLTAARSAPVLDADYSGPVLLTGGAAADMFGRILAPNLSGQRGALGNAGQQAASASELLDRMNRPVLPPNITVIDDPSLRQVGNKNLVGFYQIDDQGVPGKKVTLIENGLLTDLLMSRRPSKDRLQSNGHGRSSMPGAETAQISNMVINVTDGKPLPELKQELMKAAKAERLQYGIMLKGGTISSAVQTYKIYVDDGREELIRGASAGGVSVGSLRHIQAAGNDTFVWNGLSGQRNWELPLSVAAPSVVLEEMEFKKPSGSQTKPALLTAPALTGL